MCGDGCLYSGLMLAAWITLAHFSVSVAMILPKSAGETISIATPPSVSRAAIWIGERGIDLSIELIDDFKRRISGSDDARKCAGLEARHRISDRGTLEVPRALRSRYAECAQFSGLNVFNERSYVIEFNQHLSADKVGDHLGVTAITHMTILISPVILKFPRHGRAGAFGGDAILSFPGLALA